MNACSCDCSVLSVAFPHLASVVVEQALVDDGGVAITARSVTREAACPGCGTLCGRVHGGYRRRLADLAVAGRRVVIDLAVQRFLCQAWSCARRTFVEQIGGRRAHRAVRAPHSRTPSDAGADSTRDIRPPGWPRTCRSPSVRPR
ncbi:transposase family protein [Streptomyces sp. NPDC056161]|uniref:transposase family protein n=1 Tax=Streptomyces sp. NPDC056161 TaxID=3345732 RepID=UPI0035DB9E38